MVDPELADLVVPGDRLARAPLADRVRQHERGDEREHDDAADRHRAHDASTREGGSGGVRSVAALERADRGGGPRGVVVVELLVGAVVDVAGLALVLEIVERAQQEVALGFERLAVERRSRRRRPRASVAVAFAFDDVVVVGGRRQPRRTGSSAAARTRSRPPPITSAITGSPHAIDAEAAVRRREQDVLAVDRDVRVADLGRRSGPARMRFTTSTRIARDSGALLSATDSPVHTGHASSFSRRAAPRRGRAARSRPRRRAPRRRSPRRPRAPSHGTHHRLKRRRPRLARSGATPRARRR